MKRSKAAVDALPTPKVQTDLFHGPKGSLWRARWVCEDGEWSSWLPLVTRVAPLNERKAMEVAKRMGAEALAVERVAAQKKAAVRRECIEAARALGVPPPVLIVTFEQILATLIQAISEKHRQDPTRPSVILGEVGPSGELYGSIARYHAPFGREKEVVVSAKAATLPLLVRELARKWMEFGKAGERLRSMTLEEELERPGPDHPEGALRASRPGHGRRGEGARREGQETPASRGRCVDEGHGRRRGRRR